MPARIETASISAHCLNMRITSQPGMIVAHCAVGDENPSKCINFVCGAATDSEAQKRCNKFVDAHITWNETDWDSWL